MLGAVVEVVELLFLLEALAEVEMVRYITRTLVLLVLQIQEGVEVEP
jgi:hypothetical protein